LVGSTTTVTEIYSQPHSSTNTEMAAHVHQDQSDAQLDVCERYANMAVDTDG
jgi:hypothetical protein